ARPSTTLMMSSRLLLEKNQNAPVSPVTGTACPEPLVPMLTARQATRTLKRPSFRQSAVAPGEQALKVILNPPFPCVPAKTFAGAAGLIASASTRSSVSPSLIAVHTPPPLTVLKTPPGVPA